MCMRSGGKAENGDQKAEHEDSDDKEDKADNKDEEDEDGRHPSSQVHFLHPASWLQFRIKLVKLTGTCACV